MELRRVPHDSPYYRHFAVYVHENAGGKSYRVKWRDFYTVKQDVDFDTRERAARFAYKILSDPVIYNSDEAGGQSYDELVSYWWLVGSGGNP